MSNNVAAKVTSQLWHIEHYGRCVSVVRHLRGTDVLDVVRRIQRRLELDATLRPLINPTVDVDLLSHSLGGAAQQTWVCERDGEIVGHLYGTLLDDADYGSGVWVGPDAASFDDAEVLASL